MTVSDQAKSPFEDRASFAPLILMEYETNPGRFCLMMFDGDMETVEDVFDALNAEGNGHGWDGLAQSIAESRMPEIADRLNFGSEAGTFVVESDDLDALRRLATLLHQALHDRALLADQISKANPVYLPR